MKKLNQKYFTIAVYVLAVLAFSIVFLLFGLNLKTFFTFVGNILGKIASIFYGILFALILLPFVKMLERSFTNAFCRKKPRKFLVALFSLTTTYLLLLLVAFASVWFVIPALVDNFTELYERLLAYFGVADGNLSAAVGTVMEKLSAFVGKHSPFLVDLVASLEEYLEANVLNLQNAGSLVAKLVAFLGVLISQLSDIFLGLIISVYLLASRRVISGVCGKLVVAVFSEKHAVKLVVFFKRLYTDFCAFASSRILLSFVVCVAVFVLSWVGGIPMFSVIAIVLFLCQLIPTLGTFIGVLISSVIVLILSPVRAIFFIPALIAIEVLSTYLLMPLFLQKKLRPSHGTCAVLVLLGFALMGIVGAFLAVPVYATFSIEVRGILAHRLAKKKLPIATEAYENKDIQTILDESAVNEDEDDDASAVKTDAPQKDENASQTSL